MSEENQAEPQAPVPAEAVAADGPPDTTSSEATHDVAATADASTSAHDESAEEGAEDGAEEGEGEATASAEGQPAGDGAKKKKRRRRKKKPGAGEGAQVQGEGGEAQSKKHAPKKDPGQIPFGRYFEGANSARRHAFAAGEVVAGRVSQHLEGSFLVDLFGKAIAVVDETEPREVPQPPAAPEVQVATPAADAPASADAATTSEAAATPAEATAPANVEAEAAANAAAEAEAAAHSVHAEAEEHAAADAQAEESDAEASSAGEMAAPEEELPVLAPPAIGTIYRGRVGAVSESGHIVIVNRIVDVKVARARLEKARDEKKRVRGVVYGFNRGGFDVLVGGIRVFCPASGMALSHIEAPESYIGQKLEFTVPPQKPGFHGTVVSRRGILEREGRKAARELLKTLKVGDSVKGRVSQVRDFGFFIDIGGGLEGMVHVSEMSWDRGARPSDVAKVGDELEVRIIKIPDSKKERHERIGMSLKALQADPWTQHGELLAEGRHFKGKVARVAEFGAFIELAPGVEGLLHVSELGNNLEHANKAVKVGDEIDVIIERTDLKQHRVSLSKLTAGDLAAIAEGGGVGARPPKHGGLTKVKVDRVEHHGVFVQVVGVVGKRGRGYIPNSEMGTERGTDHRKLFPVGKELDVKVIGADRDGGLKMSRKAFTNDEEKRAVQDYRREASKQGFGTFGDLLRQKLEKGN